MLVMYPPYSGRWAHHSFVYGGTDTVWPRRWQSTRTSTPAGSVVSAEDSVVVAARTRTPEPHVPNHVPAGRVAPRTSSERVTRFRALYALPKAVPSGCSVNTATMLRSF